MTLLESFNQVHNIKTPEANIFRERLQMFEKIYDLQLIDLKQLKLKLLLFANELDAAVKRKDFTTWSGVANELRQLATSKLELSPFDL